MARRGGRAAKERVYHLDLRRGDLPTSVLLPGDPDRATAIAESWDRHEPLGEHREFRSFRGAYRGHSVGVVSVGIGGPSMAIALEELARLGVTWIIRVGSCGAIDPALKGGDLAISLGAVRFDGASRAYAPPEFPAVADPDVFQALVHAARASRFTYHSGITASVDTFYLEQGRPGFGGYAPPIVGGAVAELRRLRVMNIEMECATLLTVARLYQMRAGAICTVFDDRPDGSPVGADVAPAIHVANESLAALARARRK